MPLERRRHRPAFEVAGVGARQELLVEEEEQLAAIAVEAGQDHRPADVVAEVVEAVDGLRSIQLVVEPLVGVEGLVTLRVEPAATELAAAALGDHVDGAAGTAAVLGLVVRRQHLDLGDRIEAGREERSGVGSRVEVGDAVVREVDRVDAAAVDGQPAEVVPAGCLAIGGVDHARHQAQMPHVVAPLEGDLLDLFLADEAGALGAVGLDAGGFGLHRHGFAQGTDLEHDRAQAQSLGGGEHDSGLHGGLEAVEGDGHLVGAGEQVGDHERAGFVGCRLTGDLRPRVLDGHGRPGQDAARGVHHRTGDLTGESLCVQHGGGATQHRHAQQPREHSIPHPGPHLACRQHPWLTGYGCAAS